MPVSINQLLNLVVAGAQQIEIPEDLMEEQETIANDDGVHEHEGVRVMMVQLEDLVNRLRLGQIANEALAAQEISEKCKWIAAHRPIRRATLYSVHRLKALALEAMNRAQEDKRDWHEIVKATTMALSMWSPNDGYVDDLGMLLVKAYMQLKYYAHAVHACSKVRPGGRRRRSNTPRQPHMPRSQRMNPGRLWTTNGPPPISSTTAQPQYPGLLPPDVGSHQTLTPSQQNTVPQFMSPDNIVQDVQVESSPSSPPSPHFAPTINHSETGRYFFVKNHEIFSKYRKFALRRITDATNWKFHMINENLISALRNGQCSEDFLEEIRITPRFYFVTDEYLHAPKQLSFPTPLRIHSLGFNQSSPLMYSHSLDNLDIQEGHVCLDVGCGCGWLTVLMARRAGLTGKVHGCELKQSIAKFCYQSMERYDAANETNVLDRCFISTVNCFRLRDVQYDRINVGCQMSHDQFLRLTSLLKPDGVMVAPCDGHLTIYRRSRREKVQLFPVMFANIVEADEDEEWQTWDGRTIGDFKREEATAAFGKFCMRQVQYADVLLGLDPVWWQEQ